MSLFVKSLFKKRTKRISQNRFKGKKIPTRKKVKRRNSYPFSSYKNSSFIIFAGFISLSITVFFLIRQLQPLIKNERLKYLCTYQLGDKKSQSYKDAKLELQKLIGDNNKYCKNFLLPRERNKKGFIFFSIMKDIFFKFI